MESSNSKQKIIAISAIIVVALLAINAFLLYNKIKQDQVIEKQTTELEESQSLATELEKQYHEALSDLEEMRGTTDELNAMIDTQKEELKKQKNKINRLIKSERNLGKAREELNNMKIQVEGYLAEITQLREQNEMLSTENVTLKESNLTLTSDLDSQKALANELTEAKVILTSEKNELQEKNANLSRTVTYASVVKVADIEVTGMKTKKSGKSVKRRNAKNVDHLQICFNTTANEVTKSGVEKFYIRIINPLGETMAIEELGSGVLVNSSNNEEIRYTQVQELDYTNDVTNHCFNWMPNMPFSKGKYQVEIYNKGYTAGIGNFELK